MRRLLFAVLVVAGCGGSGASVTVPPDPLANTTWMMEVQGLPCVMGFGFYDNSTYAHLTLCTLDNGTNALEVDLGDYLVAARRLDFFLREASCPASAYITLAPSFNFSQNGNVLNLSSSTGVLTLARTQTMPGDPNGTGAAVYGCFDADGYFTPGPLAPL